MRKNILKNVTMVLILSLILCFSVNSTVYADSSVSEATDIDSVMSDIFLDYFITMTELEEEARTEIHDIYTDFSSKNTEIMQSNTNDKECIKSLAHIKKDSFLSLNRTYARNTEIRNENYQNYIDKITEASDQLKKRGVPTTEISKLTMYYIGLGKDTLQGFNLKKNIRETKKDINSLILESKGMIKEAA